MRHTKYTSRLEVGVWTKALASNPSGNCVEAMLADPQAAPVHKASAEQVVLMRDSKDPEGPRLAFDAAEWKAFLNGVKAGEFDLL